MPDNYAKKYQRAILAARKSVISDGVPKQANQLLLQSYAKLIADLNEDLANEEITEERFDALQAILIKRFNQLAVRLGVIFEQAKRTAINSMIQGHLAGIAAAEAATGLAVEVSFNDVPDNVLDLMMLRRGLNAKNYKSVINRNLQDAVEDIENYLQSAIARGLNSRRATQELSAILAGGNEEVLKLVDSDKLTRSAVNEALREGNIDPDDYKAARRVIYDSRRIIVTETNTALRTSNVICQQKSPVVKGSKWETSSRHSHLRSAPDGCDLLASVNLFDLGEGVYPSGNVPSSPHPFCGCRVSNVIASPSEWGNSYDTQQPPTISDSDVRGIMPDATDNAIERTAADINDSLQLAYEVETGGEAAA